MTNSLGTLAKIKEYISNLENISARGKTIQNPYTYILIILAGMTVHQPLSKLYSTMAGYVIEYDH